MSIDEAQKITSKIPQYRSTELRIPRSVVIFKTSWYPEIIEGMAQDAVSFLKEHHVAPESIEMIPVPGSYELPLAMELVYSSSLKPDMALALGCVVRGETPHFDFVCTEVARGVSELSIKHKVPTGFGVLTVDTLDQARARIEKGREAAHAGLSMFNLLKSVKGYF